MALQARNGEVGLAGFSLCAMDGLYDPRRHDRDYSSRVAGAKLDDVALFSAASLGDVDPRSLGSRFHLVRGNIGSYDDGVIELHLRLIIRAHLVRNQGDEPIPGISPISL